MRRLAVVVCLALALGLLGPATAFAKRGGATPSGLKVQTVYPKDAWESDDTSAQAKVLPAESLHSFHSGVDEDWLKFTAEETGTPFVIETQFLAGAWDTDMTIYEVDAGDPSGLAQLWYQDDSDVWQAYGSTAYFVAPHTGTFYVKIAPLGEDDRGFYKTFISAGIGRRVGGGDRYQTAAALSKTMYPDSPNGGWGDDAGPSGVMVVNGSAFPDALSAGAYGAMGHGGDAEPYPVLLTRQDSLSPDTSAEIVRLAQTAWWASDNFTVYVVGGPSVVSDAQLQLIKELPYVYDAVRVGGINRYDTAAQVASLAVNGDVTPAALRPRSGGSKTPQAAYEGAFVLVNGFAWPDGVSVGSLCGAMGAPMLLSKVDTIPVETQQWILDHHPTNVVIVGSEKVVSDEVAAALEAEPYNLYVERVAGPGRYETSYEVASYGVENGYFDPSGFTLATGEGFPDGLAAGPFSMLTGWYYGPGPVLLTPRSGLHDTVYQFYGAYGPTERPSYLIGGRGALSDELLDEFNALWNAEFEPPMPPE